MSLVSLMSSQTAVLLYFVQWCAFRDNVYHWGQYIGRRWMEGFTKFKTAKPTLRKKQQVKCFIAFWVVWALF